MNFAALKSIQTSIAAQGGIHLGTLLWWSLNGNHVERPDLEALARQCGLDERYLPPPIKPTTAFRRAWRGAAANLGQGLMLREIAEDEKAITIGLVQEQVDRTKLELEYANLARITFDKTTDFIITDGEHEVLQGVRDLYQHHLAHTTEDIRFMLTTFVRKAGVSLRENGGTYFIPASYQQTLSALAAVVTGVGHNLVYELPLFDAPQVRQTLTEVAKATLDAEIQAVQVELAGFDDSTRQSTLERRLARFDELRSRVELFAGVLSFKADDLKSKLAAANRDLRVKLGLEPMAKVVAMGTSTADETTGDEGGDEHGSARVDEIAGF